MVRTRHVRRECGSDPSFGCAPEERPLREYVEWAFVPLDKPSGPTSRDAADCVARLLHASRAGHGGTLDPKVTGVLPVLLGRSTRVASLLLGCDKTYLGRLRLHGEVTDSELESALERFRGVIQQVPPRRSAVKRRPRERTVHRFEVTDRDGRDVGFLAEVEGGTYIRKLAHDLGEHLGCGAHMTELRRTQAGAIALDECATLQELTEAAEPADGGDEEPLRRLVWPVEQVVARVVPRVWTDDGAVPSLCTGYPLAAPGVAELEDFGAGQTVAVMTLKGELIGTGTAEAGSEHALQAGEGVVVRLHQVLMEPGTYTDHAQ
ncbi:MAG: RNA-guided pseudouridylation complex pseudouridine synthase subunit Cbf5 [Candidatus Brocadiia bacterium]